MPSLETLAGIVGALLPLIQLTISTLRQRNVEERVAEELLERKLEPAHLKSLGDYLDQKLGAIDIRRYAQSANARSRVDRVLERLAEFQGPEESPTEPLVQDLQEVLPFAEPPAAANIGTSENLPEEVSSRLNLGDEWGALVKLRAALEIETQRVLAKHGVTDTETMPQVRMLDILARRELLSPDAIGAAHVARKAANRAVHGQTLLPDELAAALHSGAFALKELHKALDEAE